MSHFFARNDGDLPSKSTVIVSAPGSSERFYLFQFIYETQTTAWHIFLEAKNPLLKNECLNFLVLIEEDNQQLFSIFCWEDRITLNILPHLFNYVSRHSFVL